MTEIYTTLIGKARSHSPIVLGLSFSPCFFFFFGSKLFKIQVLLVSRVWQDIYQITEF